MSWMRRAGGYFCDVKDEELERWQHSERRCWVGMTLLATACVIGKGEQRDGHEGGDMQTR